MSVLALDKRSVPTGLDVAGHREQNRGISVLVLSGAKAGTSSVGSAERRGGN